MMGLAAFSAKPSRHRVGVAVIDVGASAVRCLIARAVRRGELEILGWASRAHNAIRDGGVVDTPKFQDVLLTALDEAEQLAGVRVNRVIASFGGRLRSCAVLGRSGLMRAPVSDPDMRRALNAALSQCQRPDWRQVHACPVSWTVDDGASLADPRGRRGAHLTVSVTSVSAAELATRSVARAIEGAGLDVRAVIAAPYAAGLAILDDEERALGGAVIDFGAAATRMAMFVDGALAGVVSVPVGSDRVTSDLAEGLSVTLAQADDIKRRHASLSHAALTDGSPIALNTGDAHGEERMTTMASVSVIAHARVEETLKLLHDRACKLPAMEMAGEHILITGGGARLRGLATLAGKVFSAKVRRGALRGVVNGEARDDPFEMATAVGLARFGLDRPADYAAWPHDAWDMQSARSSKTPGRVHRTIAWLQQNI